MRMPCESCRYSLCPCTLWEKPAVVNRLLMMAVFNGPRTGQWFETLFGGAAHRTVPIFGCLIEGRAFGYFTFAIASVGIVNAAAIHRLALIHVSRFGHGRTPYTSNRLQKTPWRLMRKKITTPSIESMPMPHGQVGLSGRRCLKRCSWNRAQWPTFFNTG
jgi:hypothetical protein